MISPKFRALETASTTEEPIWSEFKRVMFRTNLDVISGVYGIFFRGARPISGRKVTSKKKNMLKTFIPLGRVLKFDSVVVPIEMPIFHEKWTN